ncbi:hypothetical protein D3C80_1604480 [compost metagenome]
MAGAGIPGAGHQVGSPVGFKLAALDAALARAHRGDSANPDQVVELALQFNECWSHGAIVLGAGSKGEWWRVCRALAHPANAKQS